MKHVELEQFLHAFASRVFVSISWAFLLAHRWQTVLNYMWCTHFSPHLIHVNAATAWLLVGYRA